jgi:hypothetical protein
MSEDVTDIKTRKRQRLVPNGANPDPELLAFMRERLETIERENAERLDLIRKGRDHPIELYQKLVHNHAALGLPKSQIACLLGISVNTLEQYYSDEVDVGIAEINLKIAANVARKALSDDPDAARIGLDWLDRRGGDGWRKSTQKVEMVDDKPPLIDATKMTYEERQVLKQIFTRIAEGGEGDPLQPDEV